MTLNTETCEEWSAELVQRVLDRIEESSGEPQKRPSTDTAVTIIPGDPSPKRGRGRPKGSKNVKHSITTHVPKRVKVALDDLCQANNTNTSQMVKRILTLALEHPDLWIE